MLLVIAKPDHKHIVAMIVDYASMTCDSAPLIFSSEEFELRAIKLGGKLRLKLTARSWNPFARMYEFFCTKPLVVSHSVAHFQDEEAAANTLRQMIADVEERRFRSEIGNRWHHTAKMIPSQRRAVDRRLTDNPILARAIADSLHSSRKASSDTKSVQDALKELKRAIRTRQHTE